MTATKEPTLDAPGAGLPAAELFVARNLFAMKCKMGNREAFIDGFRDERNQIRDLIKSCPLAQRDERVLIPRLRGLEDSSRHYSVWMTLDHLRMTNDAFAFFITELTQGRVPDMVVSTASVKPDPRVTEAIEADYEKSCNALLDTLKTAPDLKTEAEFTHPWFGPLNAYRWLALASIHMGIHRAQIATIIQDLPK